LVVKVELLWRTARAEPRHGWSLEQLPIEIERERRGPGAMQIERERERERRGSE
jgi:hypothetical protein